MNKVDQTINQIQTILLEDTRGLTIQELSDQTKVSRVTCGMALMKLDGAKLIDVRVIGNCRLHYLKKQLPFGDSRISKGNSKHLKKEVKK